MIYQYVCRDCEEVLNPEDINDHRGTHGPVTRIVRKDLYEEQHGTVNQND